MFQDANLYIRSYFDRLTFRLNHVTMFISTADMLLILWGCTFFHHNLETLTSYTFISPNFSSNYFILFWCNICAYWGYIPDPASLRLVAFEIDTWPSLSASADIIRSLTGIKCRSHSPVYTWTNRNKIIKKSWITRKWHKKLEKLHDNPKFRNNCMKIFPRTA